METPKKKKKIDRAYKTVRPLFSYCAKERGAKACETKTRSLRLKNENRKGGKKRTGARKPPKQLRRGKSWTDATVILSAQPFLWNNKKHTECGKPGPRKQNDLNTKRRKELETGCEKKIWPKAQNLCSRHAHKSGRCCTYKTRKKVESFIFLSSKPTTDTNECAADERTSAGEEREREKDHICPNERAQTCKFYLPESLAKFRVPNLAGLGFVSPGSDRTSFKPMCLVRLANLIGSNQLLGGYQYHPF